MNTCWRFRAVFTELEDRRVLYSPYELESPPHCVESVVQIRQFLSSVLQELDRDGTLTRSIRAMRGECRRFMDRVGARSADHPSNPFAALSTNGSSTAPSAS